jgi:hypothetical protein
MVRACAAALLGALLTASMVSCGGASFDGDDDGAAGSGGSSAGQGGGPSGGQGGAGNAGGGPSAGTTGNAGTGSGGAPADLCSLPAQSGMCNAFFPSFFHDAETGVCEPFIYGGCGGNENRFDSVEACQAACSGGLPDMDACTSPSECVLATAQCCAPCDGGLESYTAVNAASLDAFSAAHDCGGVGCAPCPAPDPLTATRPYLAATCRNGQCVPIDVRLEGAAECGQPEDCRLRMGVGCCEGCGGDFSSLVAVNNSGEWVNLVCGPDLVACPGCEPIYPPEYAATCDAGRCALISVP